MVQEANLNTQIETEVAEITEGEARGGTSITDTKKRQNFALCFGCKPSGGVLAQTKMIMDVVKILLEDFSRETFTVQFIDCFDDLKSSDANFEMVSSNTL